MKLVIVSHKQCWPASCGPPHHATRGGFPAQIKALSELFDCTLLLVPVRQHGPSNGEQLLCGNRLTVRPLDALPATLVSRRRSYFRWLFLNGPTIWRSVRDADAVYAPIPGDVGTFGLLAALIQRKPLFVRYCGDWDCLQTRAQRAWKWLLEHSAGGRTVAMVAGLRAGPPSRGNQSIRWIFSTSLTTSDIDACRRLRSRAPATAPRLICVSRQERAKGTGLLIDSMPRIAEYFPGARLEVVGDGQDLPTFREQAMTLGLADSVTFHGQLDHDRVLALMGEADLFCFPSEREGFPKAVVEALACGLPVVATPVSLVPQLAQSGCAVIVHERSSKSLSDAVYVALSNTDNYTSMSARALEVVRDFSLERWRDDMGRELEAAWGPLKSDG